MVSIIAACSRTHFASSAVASRATAISASKSNFFIVERPPTRPRFDVKQLQQAAARPTDLTVVGAPHSARRDRREMSFLDIGQFVLLRNPSSAPTLAWCC
jgi:hypothetical protein